MIRAWFINMFGHEFSRDFESGAELEAFIDRAAKVGTKLITFVSIY